MLAVQVLLSSALRARCSPARLDTTQPALIALAVLLGLALCARLLVDLDAGHATRWIGVAAGCFLGATLAWAAALLGGPGQGDAEAQHC